MIVLVSFAFIAGAATAVSPCVLPVLPIALSAGATGGRRRPLGVVTGLAVSFTFATVALVYVISAFGLPDELLRTLAIAALIGFGLSLMVPWLGDRLEARLSRIGPASRLAGAQSGSGFWSGAIVGGGLGFVYNGPKTKACRTEVRPAGMGGYPRRSAIGCCRGANSPTG